MRLESRLRHRTHRHSGSTTSMALDTVVDGPVIAVADAAAGFAPPPALGPAQGLPPPLPAAWGNEGGCDGFAGAAGGQW